eukprot:9050495-Lingulodinium_polyedra.AAC.1
MMASCSDGPRSCGWSFVNWRQKTWCPTGPTPRRERNSELHAGVRGPLTGQTAKSSRLQHST